MATWASGFPGGEARDSVNLVHCEPCFSCLKADRKNYYLHIIDLQKHAELAESEVPFAFAFYHTFDCFGFSWISLVLFSPCEE